MTQESQEIKKWIKDVDKKLDNHLTEILPKIAKIETDLTWLKRFFWIVATASIGSLITGIIQLL